MLLLHLPLRLLLTYSNMFCIVLQESALDLTELEDALVLVKQKKQRAAPDPDFLQKVDMEINKGQNIHSSLNMIQCVCVCMHTHVCIPMYANECTNTSRHFSAHVLSKWLCLSEGKKN